MFLLWLLAFIVLFIGCCLQTAIGFGMAVLAAPVMMLLYPDWVPYVLTSTALILSLLNAWQLRAHSDIKKLLPACISRVPGTIVGLALLMTINILWLQLIVALCVLLAVGLSFYSFRFDATSKKLGWAGFISGVMGTTTSIGGPPMAMVMQFGDPHTVRANLSLYFTYCCILSLVAYAAGGLISTELIIDSISFMPAALLGFICGTHLRPWADHQRFRHVLLLVCGLAGFIALIGAMSKILSL